MSHLNTLNLRAQEKQRAIENAGDDDNDDELPLMC